MITEKCKENNVPENPDRVEHIRKVRNEQEGRRNYGRV